MHLQQQPNRPIDQKKEECWKDFQQLQRRDRHQYLLLRLQVPPHSLPLKDTDRSVGWWRW